MNNNPEKTATDFLSTYYSVNDYNMYKKIFIDEVVVNNPEKEKERILNFFDKYKKYLFEDNFNTQFLANRVCLNYLKDCYDNKYTVKVSDITLKKTSEDSNMIVYTYTVSLKKVYQNNKESAATAEGQLQASKSQNRWLLKFYPYL